MSNQALNAAVVFAVITILTFIHESNAKSSRLHIKLESKKMPNIKRTVVSNAERIVRDIKDNIKAEKEQWHKTVKNRRIGRIISKLRRHRRAINRNFLYTPEESKNNGDKLKQHRIEGFVPTEIVSRFSGNVPPIAKDGFNYQVSHENNQYGNVPLEALAQFGGNVPLEIIEQYNVPNTLQESTDPYLSNRIENYRNIPREIVLQYGGQVPREVAAQFGNVEARVPQPDRPAGSETAGNPDDLPPVEFGEFNYNYDLKPPSVCVHQDNDTAETEEGEVEKTTAGPKPPPPPDPHIPLTANQKESLLREHNKYRATIKPKAADMRLISWDDELSWVSETFTNSCYYRDIVEPPMINGNDTRVHPTIELKRHSYITSEIGHTWYAWPNTYEIPVDFSTTSLSAWVSERDFYNIDAKECDGICEHYLQIIWAETFKMGCGVAWCEEPNINGIVWPQAILMVCSYTPRGALANYMASNSRFKFFDPKLFVDPYVPGRPCSLCVLELKDPNQHIDDMRSTTDECWNDLCSNEVRDKLIPFIPPVRTTTLVWIQTPATSPPTESKSTTQDIEIQMDAGDEIIVPEDSAPIVSVNYCLVLFLCTLTKTIL